MKLFCEILGGNLFQATDIINEKCPEIIPGIVTMDCTDPYNHTVVVYRADEPAKLFKRPDPTPLADL